MGRSECSTHTGSLLIHLHGMQINRSKEHYGNQTKKTDLVHFDGNPCLLRTPWKPKNLKWVKNKVTALGVWFSTAPKIPMELSYSDRIAKVSHCPCSWEYRRLSLLGKITDSSTFSKLVYILSTLPINYRVLKELTKFKNLFQFSWSGKGNISKTWWSAIIRKKV